MNSKTIKNISKFIMCFVVLMFPLFLLACDENFENATKLNVNASNTTDANMKFNSLKINAEEEVYLTWTISAQAKQTASHYILIILDENKHALTSENKLTEVNLYNTSKKALGTVETTKEGEYNLSAILADEKIKEGTYYAVCKFAQSGIYNLAILLNE